MTASESRPVKENRAASRTETDPRQSSDTQFTPDRPVPGWLAERVAEHQQRREETGHGRGQFQRNRGHGLEARTAAKVRRMPPAELAALLADALNWRRLVAMEEANRRAWTYADELTELRRITSVEPCASSGCDTQVELAHPLPRWAAALLPDLSWVRCPQHREGVA